MWCQNLTIDSWSGREVELRYLRDFLLEPFQLSLSFFCKGIARKNTHTLLYGRFSAQFDGL